MKTAVIALMVFLFSAQTVNAARMKGEMKVTLSYVKSDGDANVYLGDRVLVYLKLKVRQGLRVQKQETSTSADLKDASMIVGQDEIIMVAKDGKRTYVPMKMVSGKMVARGDLVGNSLGASVSISGGASAAVYSDFVCEKPSASTLSCTLTANISAKN